MGNINIGKWVSLGIKIASYIPTAIQVVETVKSGFGGADKRKAAVDATQVFVGMTEDVLERDIVNDPEVAKAVGEAIDALVKVQNVVAAVKAAKVSKTAE